jgi:hypothetical protein
MMTTDVSGYATYTQNVTINLNFHDAFQACKQCAASATYTTISLARVAISVLDANTVHCILQPQEWKNR